MNRNAIKFGIVCAIAVGCYSCSLISKAMDRMHGPTKCCYFNPAENKISLACQGQYINKIIVSTSKADEYVADSILIEESIPNASEIILPPIADSIKQTKKMIITLWYQNYVIWDYTIEVNPSDWVTGKILYGQYSYR